MELSGFPDWNIDRTFTLVFYFPQESMKAKIIKRTYRNPIYLAKEYKEMIDSGKVKNQAGLARMKGISRARVTQILNLLKLDKKLIYELEKFGDPKETAIHSSSKKVNTWPIFWKKPRLSGWVASRAGWERYCHH